jgi:hypothetical protein
MALEAMVGEMTEEMAAAALRYETALEMRGRAAARLDRGLDAEPGGEPEEERDEGPGVGLPYEAFLNPMELKLAHKIVDGLEPGDPQEEIHAWHLAVSHPFAAERIGKARQPDLPLRPQQIEMGLAVRIMTLCDRKSAALDRHRAFRQKAAEQAARAAEKAADAAQAAARQRARDAEKAAEDAAREEATALRTEYWEAREQERLEAAEDQGAPGAPDPTTTYPTAGAVTPRPAEERAVDPGSIPGPRVNAQGRPRVNAWGRPGGDTGRR